MSNDFYAKYSVDSDLYENGVWIDGFAGGAEVKFRNPQSVKARDVLRRLQEHPDFKVVLQRAERGKEKVPLEIEDDMNRRWMAQGLIVDWRKVPARDGGEIQFSAKAAMDLFKDVPFFYEECWAAVGGRSQFQPVDAEAAKVDLGN